MENFFENSLRAAFLFFLSTILFETGQAQNGIVGDGFGGRLWYRPFNYSVGSYSAFSVCGSNKQLYGWGSNWLSELGDGTTKSLTLPVAALGMTNVKYVTSGYITAAIKTDSTGWAWGIGGDAVSTGFDSIPREVMNNVKFVDVSTSHYVFVRYDGSVWSVGVNYGQFGLGYSPGFEVDTVPKQMIGINNAVRVACGSGSTIILLADGTVKQVVSPSNPLQAGTNGFLPKVVPALSNVVDIKAITQNVIALTSNGEIFSWGTHYSEALGYPASQDVYIPQKITFPPGASSIVAISGVDDGKGFYALDSAGNVYSWGLQCTIGNGSGLAQTTPVLSNSNCKDILCGELFGYVIKNDNTLWATGVSFYDNTQGSVFMDIPDSTYPAFHKNWVQLHPQSGSMNPCLPEVVPVELINFLATLKENTVVLTWTVGEQININKYVVEHSKNGQLFSAIEEVQADKYLTTYFARHNFPDIGVNFYRLCIVENDGKKHYSTIKQVKINGPRLLSVFPDPVKSRLNVVFNHSLFNNEDIITINTVEGKLIFRINIRDFYVLKTIDVSNWNAGVYILSIKNKTETIHHQFLVIK